MPRDALIAASRDVPGVEHLAAVAAAPHGDVAQALRVTAERHGGAGLQRLAAAWQVSERSGSGLAPSVSRLAATLRDEEQVRREVAAQLAGPRATAVLLALLPVFGLAMGNALGASPVSVLVGTPLGRGCLGLGLALESAGLLWTARITRRAEPP
jgi:tight adherence protein B